MNTFKLILYNRLYLRDVIVVDQIITENPEPNRDHTGRYKAQQADDSTNNHKWNHPHVRAAREVGE